MTVFCYMSLKNSNGIFPFGQHSSAACPPGRCSCRLLHAFLLQDQIPFLHAHAGVFEYTET